MTSVAGWWSVTEPTTAGSWGWLTVGRAYDALAQFLDPVEGGQTVIAADPATSELVCVLVGVAAGYARAATPDVSDRELAAALRGTANVIREVESLGG
ncbi:hypothetical protein [Gordonia sputi]|uniref:hypothetical protein n=1 Tax=Gordonia sputi TaxID=36823 RepID=UPI0022700490|nr:hypothetical protein [Gordonia sputi]